MTNRELTSRLLEACGADWSMVEPVVDRLGHDRRYSLDTTKIASELGYSPRVAFDEGLADTIRWYRENRRWWSPLRARLNTA
jgi:dTDP-glucose 4,6-dehydratase